jgi:hypothetical protein
LPKALFFNDLSGSYAIYSDHRFGDDVYLGLCDVGNNTILARSYEPKGNNELVVLIPLIKENNTIDIGDQIKVLKGDLKCSKASGRLIPLLLN